MTSPDSIFFLINRCSGGKQPQRLIEQLQRMAQVAEQNITVSFLGDKDLKTQISELRKNKIAVIAGGDGTLSRILPKLQGYHGKIGVLPLGTANDLACELGIEKSAALQDARPLLEFYRNTSTRLVSLYALEFGENYTNRLDFVNYVSFGFEAAVASDFARWRRGKFGAVFRGVWTNRLAYLILGFLNLGTKIRSGSGIEIKSQSSCSAIGNCRSIIFANIKSIMGLGWSNPSSSMFDTSLESIVINNLRAYFAVVARYRIPLFRPNLLGSSPTWVIQGIPAGTPIQIDGEPVSKLSCSTFRIVLSGKVNLITSRASE